MLDAKSIYANHFVKISTLKAIAFSFGLKIGLRRKFMFLLKINSNFFLPKLSLGQKEVSQRLSHYFKKFSHFFFEIFDFLKKHQNFCKIITDLEIDSYFSFYYLASLISMCVQKKSSKFRNQPLVAQNHVV